jgi:hypothetical protein
LQNVDQESPERDIKSGNEDDDQQTRDIAVLAPDGTESVKEVFLDRLAEMLCREKNSPFIASTGMVEAENKVTIFAARNGARWTDRDVQLMEELATVMESLFLKGSVVIPSRFSLSVSD